MSKKIISLKDFGNDFKWGVASAAYQIEGNHQADGKSESVWDRFSHTKGKILDKTNGDDACDFYNRYKEDIANIKNMNMKVNRFSTSWTRILPDGTGKVNQKGIDFYHKVIDATLEAGLEPWITLYHWDLPQILEDKGGWKNREIIKWFSEYVDVVTRNYGEKVKNWMVLNEPTIFTAAGYMLGVHAPGKKGIMNFMPAAHHAAMCQAEGARIIRQNVSDANIGTTFSASHVEAVNDKECNIKAAARVDALINRMFIEPALGMGYPAEVEKMFGRWMKKYIKEGDIASLKFDFDFVGLQTYTRYLAKFCLFPPILFAKEIAPKKRGNPTTDMGWEIYPDGIYHLLKKYSKYPIKNIYVTENGCAFPDVINNGVVNDEKRIEYFNDYLSAVLKAKNEGVNVKGYFVWSLIDNFEWAEGLRPRFGLVYCDYKTQQRTIKNSGLWFKELLNE